MSASPDEKTSFCVSSESRDCEDLHHALIEPHRIDQDGQGSDPDTTQASSIVPDPSDQCRPNTSEHHPHPPRFNTASFLVNQQKPELLLRYRSTALILYVIYVPFLIAPWIIYTVLSVKATGYQQRVGVAEKQASNWSRSIYAAQILSSIAAILTVPVIGAVLARAVVVYTQRRSTAQRLSLQQTLALADRAWGDVPFILNLIFGASHSAGSWFLYLGALILLFSSIIQPLQQILLHFETVAVPTTDSFYTATTLAYDPELYDMSLLTQNVIALKTLNSISTALPQEFDPHLWMDPTGVQDSQSPWYGYQDYANTQQLSYYLDPGPQQGIPTNGFFISAFPNGASTGVLRYHALRQNFTISCENGPLDAYPSSCLGQAPFTTTYSDPSYLNISICVPGEIGEFPWKMERNRQDILEDVYILIDPGKGIFGNLGVTYGNDIPFTLHCQVKTTTGYFELANYHNGFQYGPLLDTWPGVNAIADDYNDQLGQDFGGALPSESVSPPRSLSFDDQSSYEYAQPDPFLDSNTQVSGPLMQTMISIFGNQSMFWMANHVNSSDSPPPIEELCLRQTIPFATLGIFLSEWDGICNGIADTIEDHPFSDTHILSVVLYDWAFNSFSDTAGAEKALYYGMYWTLRNILTETVANSWVDTARPIAYSAGAMVTNPNLSLPAIIVISVLILMELVALTYMVLYTYKAPTWTSTLDAIATARIGASVRDIDMLPLRPMDKRFMNQLKFADGIIGLEEEGDGNNPTSDLRLAVGGSGIISRRTIPKQKN